MNTKHYQIIKSPITTEKSTLQSANNVIVFKVDINATKIEIAKSVEKIYNVKVKSVNTVTLPGKKKVFRNHIGYRSDIKKAYVRLEPGSVLDITLPIN